MSGRLIVVEGLDGVGKTTLSRALAEHLGAVWTTTPDPELRAVRERLDQTWEVGERALFYAGAVLQAGRSARVHLDAGRDVVVDRYWGTTWAYARADRAEGLLSGLEQAVRPADATVWVSAAEAVRRRRLASRGLSTLDAAALERSAAIFAAYDEVLARPVSGDVLAVDAGAAHVAVLVQGLVPLLAAIRAHGGGAQLDLFGGPGAEGSRPSNGRTSVDGRRAVRLPLAS